MTDFPNTTTVIWSYFLKLLRYNYKTLYVCCQQWTWGLHLKSDLGRYVADIIQNTNKVLCNCLFAEIILDNRAHKNDRICVHCTRNINIVSSYIKVINRRALLVKQKYGISSCRKMNSELLFNVAIALIYSVNKITICLVQNKIFN